VLIGLSSAALLLFNGRIAGISGIVYSLVKRPDWSEWTWRIAFVIGLMGAGGATMHWLGQSTPSPVGTPRCCSPDCCRLRYQHGQRLHERSWVCGLAGCPNDRWWRCSRHDGGDHHGVCRAPSVGGCRVIRLLVALLCGALFGVGWRFRK